MTHHDEARGARNGHNSHNGQTPKALASARGQRSSSLNSQWLRDFLSEMLAVEKGGVKLYQKALDELTHSEYEDKLNEFLRQTERHVELCTAMRLRPAPTPTIKVRLRPRITRRKGSSAPRRRQR